MPIQSCSPGYQGSNLAATARQRVLVAPIDGEDGGEDAGLGLKAPLEGRRVRHVEGLLDGLGELVEVAKIVVLLEAVEPGCVAREECQIVDVGVVRLRGLRLELRPPVLHILHAARFADIIKKISIALLV